jgi:acetyl-CoA C-acetyltransferase
MFAGKDHVSPQAGRDAAAALWRQAGITSPLDEIDVAEIYVPFSWYEPMWLENLGFAAPGQGWRLTEAGQTALGGRLPVNPSGGVLSSNPIGASGLLRFAEAALQVMGKAGAHQVPGARTALGHAYGGGSQFFSMWVVGHPLLIVLATTNVLAWPTWLSRSRSPIAAACCNCWGTANRR